MVEQRERRHKHRQTTEGGNLQNFRTYLHPLPIDFHEQDAEGVRFGSDIPVQKVLAADGQLDFADTVLGADGPRRRGSHGVRHGLQRQQLQAVCGTQERRKTSVRAERQKTLCWHQWGGHRQRGHIQSFAL